jgi:5-methylcytosine-specific restriction endonuclease McrA
MNYQEQLKDVRWQKLRLKIMARDKWKCRVCKRGDKTLAVHHLFYNPSGMAWDIDKKWLVTVCEGCHKFLEDTKYGKPVFTDKDYRRMYNRIKRKNEPGQRGEGR